MSADVAGPSINPVASSPDVIDVDLLPGGNNDEDSDDDIVFVRAVRRRVDGEGRYVSSRSSSTTNRGESHRQSSESQH